MSITSSENIPSASATLNIAYSKWCKAICLRHKAHKPIGSGGHAIGQRFLCIYSSSGPHAELTGYSIKYPFETKDNHLTALIL